MSSSSKGKWWLKIIALALAIVIYYTLKDDTTVDNRLKGNYVQERSIFQSR